jgi:Histone deacetylation protein Rxt3
MIRISPVVNAAAKYPRRHLGSFLYSPVISVPDLHTPVRTRLNVSIRPNLIPSFKDPLQTNCTYTIRVSRTWLREAERETICAERFLWGSGIYSDDSDPIAAAVHSGFIKGAWSEWVDTSLLEQVIKEQNPGIDMKENVPDQPVEPPDGEDLHITLLVLPQLEKYAESARFGMKSRTWPEEAKDAPHDGVSFMVLNCEWVDEGSARGQERSGLTRRKRLHALMVPVPQTQLQTQSQSIVAA